MEKAERQQSLQSKFNFQCKCERCESPQLESISHSSCLQIDLDSGFQSVMTNLERVLNEGAGHDHFESEKMKIFDILKKFKNTKWCIEISRLVYHLFTFALADTESGVGGMPFTGWVLNVVPSEFR